MLFNELDEIKKAMGERIATYCTDDAFAAELSRTLNEFLTNAYDLGKLHSGFTTTNAISNMYADGTKSTHAGSEPWDK